VYGALGEIGLAAGLAKEMKEVAMKALIAENDCETVDNITMVLNICFPDWQLVTTDSGKQCLDMVKDNSLGIVILGDLLDMSGSDVIEQIRGYSEVPVMVLSHINDEPSVVKAFDAGADGYMTKPFHQLELAVRIRTLLRNKTISNTNIQAKRRVKQ
jgi:DNA-binding response OmpR family regulator